MRHSITYPSMHCVCVIAALALTSVAVTTQAADPWPTCPVRVVLSFGASGGEGGVSVRYASTKGRTLPNSVMRLISNRPLREFARMHPAAAAPLRGWRGVIERGRFQSFAELKRTFNSVDKVSDYFVFNIAGNNYRVIAAIHFNTQILYVRSVMTHAEYDRWRP
jgi:mRNA interferase HigB